MKRITTFLLTVLLLLSLVACGGKGTWQEQYDLGMRYLNEGNYEEAVIAFTAAIEIDAKRPEAYLGAAEAYIAADDIDAAIAILEKGYAATNDDSLKSRLDEIKSGTFNDYWGRVRRTMHYNGSGALIGWFSYAYNINGADRTVTAFDAAGNQTAYGEDTWEDTENGRNGTYYGEYIEEDSLWLQRIDSEVTYQDDGDVEEQVYYDRDGAVSWRGRNYYDANHRCIRSESLELDGTLNGYDISEYDENGNLTRYSQYGADDSLVAYSVLQYDENGNMIQSESYDADGRMRDYSVNTFDENGNQIRSETYDGDGTLLYSSVSD